MLSCQWQIHLCLFCGRDFKWLRVLTRCTIFFPCLRNVGFLFVCYREFSHFRPSNLTDNNAATENKKKPEPLGKKSRCFQEFFTWSRKMSSISSANTLATKLRHRLGRVAREQREWSTPEPEKITQITLAAETNFGEVTTALTWARSILAKLYVSGIGITTGLGRNIIC